MDFEVLNSTYSCTNVSNYDICLPVLTTMEHYVSGIIYVPCATTGGIVVIGWGQQGRWRKLDEVVTVLLMNQQEERQVAVGRFG